MQKINFKMNIGTMLGIAFFLILFLAILFKDSVFSFITSQSNGDVVQSSQKAAKDTADLLLSLDKISLNTSILSAPYLQNLIPLPNFPIDAQTLSNFGKANPFLGGFVVVSSPATTSVGAVIYSNQREVNNDRSLRAVKPATTTPTTRR